MIGGSSAAFVSHVKAESRSRSLCDLATRSVFIISISSFFPL